MIYKMNFQIIHSVYIKNEQRIPYQEFNVFERTFD
jgi:hypothetical protein